MWRKKRQRDNSGRNINGVVYLRWPNGGGWVARDAKIAPTVYVGPDAVIGPSAQLGEHAAVTGNVRIGVDDNITISGGLITGAGDGVRISSKGTQRVSGSIISGGDYHT